MKIEHQYKIKDFIDPQILLSFKIEGHLEITGNGDVVFAVDRIKKTR